MFPHSFLYWFLASQRETDLECSEQLAALSLGLMLTVDLSTSASILMVWVPFQVAHGALSDGALDAVETQKELLGASGLMLLLPPRVKSVDAAEEDVYWLSALLQTKQLLQAKPFQPALPLAVLAPSPGGDAVEKDVEEGL